MHEWQKVGMVPEEIAECENAVATPEPDATGEHQAEAARTQCAACEREATQSPRAIAGVADDPLDDLDGNLERNGHGRWTGDGSRFAE